MLSVEVDGKQYALIPLCTFHDIPCVDRHDVVLNQFGLKDKFIAFSLYEISDPQKLMMAKIKYGI